MEYKTIPYGERYAIVNEDTFWLEKKSTSNLNENELKIVFLETEACPVNNDICIYCMGTGEPDYHITSICKYLGAPTMDERGKLIIEKLFCNHEDSLGDLKVKLLHTEKCPIEKSNCLKCEYIEGIVIPSQGSPEKSHAYVICNYKKE